LVLVAHNTLAIVPVHIIFNVLYVVKRWQNEKSFRIIEERRAEKVDDRDTIYKILKKHKQKIDG
jgi:hypothetical protein